MGAVLHISRRAVSYFLYYSYMKYLLSLILAFSLIVPMGAQAASNLEVSGWIPYWAVSKGVKDAKAHLNDLAMIHPFGYTVKTDGSLNDEAKLTNRTWKDLFSAAKKKGVKVVPTVMWSDRANMGRILSDPTLRKEHVAAVAAAVKKGGFDGIDIDYENKAAETRDDYSAFLRELDTALGKGKILSCTIEARTPPESLYRVVPANLEYANDYAVIGSVCDRVNIMAYDQGRADWKLNDARSGTPYIPVGDIDWARKVLELAMRSIPKEKIVLGVATYGSEYDLVVAPNWYKDYQKKWSLSHGYAEDVADDFNVTPSRNKAGEMSFTYLPKGVSIPSSYKAPKGTASGNIAAARALAYANATGKTVTIRIVSWSDGEAIGQKAALAEEFGLKGIAIFKLDGGADRTLWREI